MTHRRNVLVTGAASGIGRHLTSALADAGHWVLASDADRETLEASAETQEWDVAGVETIELDVTHPEDWREALERAEEERAGIDLLIHSAGVYIPGKIVETAPEEIDAQVDVNLKGTMYGTRIVGAAMAERGRGHIVNFGSLASLAPVPGFGIYAGTKFGVRGFSLAAAEELREEGVDVTLVMPDAVDTSMLETVAGSDETAVGFSGTILTVDDIEDVLFDTILPDRPLEISIPRNRGALARLGNFAPGLVRVLRPLLEKIGRAQQRRYRDS